MTGFCTFRWLTTHNVKDNASDGKIKQNNNMANVKEAKLKDLIQDDRNLNAGTERGQQLIEKSLREFGAGRSILLDKNNRIIAGNKTHKNAELAGLDDVIIVETDGTKLVAVKRTDVDLDTKKGRKMALADNATVKADLAWNTEELNAVADDFGIDTDEWDVELEYTPDENDQVGASTNASSLKTLVFGSNRVPMSDDEFEQLEAKLELYNATNGTIYGFVQSLLDGNN